MTALSFLIVDDSKPVCMMVSAMLNERNVENVRAENGQVAIDILKADHDIDLVLLDWNMPVMTGPEFLEYNKENKITTIPIVMMTTENKPEYIKQALMLGASEYIMKPFTADILFNKIELVLE